MAWNRQSVRPRSDPPKDTHSNPMDDAFGLIWFKPKKCVLIFTTIRVSLQNKLMTNTQTHTKGTTMLKLLAALLLCTALNAAGLKVICLGDSHSTVEAGMGQALSKAAHQPVSYESIGVNGAKVQDLLKSLTTHQPPFWPRIQHITHPDIVLLAFGTNDAMSRPTNAYELTWEALIESVKNAYPKAKIIVLGPPSSLPTKVPYLQEVAQFQLSITQLMGVQWIDRFGSEELQLDGVHLTHRAYAKLAEKVASQVTF